MTKGDFLVAYNIGHRDGKTDAYCPNDYDDIFDIGQQSCDHSEKPNKWINKPQESENEKIIRISKGTLKARTGKYVIYDVEWLKTHFNTTEAKIYGQPSEDCISRKAVLDGLASIAKAKAKSDAQKSLMGRVMFFAEHLPSVTPQPETEGARGDIPLQQSVPKMPQPSERTEERTETHACDLEQIIKTTIKEYIDKDCDDVTELLLTLNKDLCERIRKEN